VDAPVSTAVERLAHKVARTLTSHPRLSDHMDPASPLTEAAIVRRWMERRSLLARGERRLAHAHDVDADAPAAPLVEER
jgi:hypothetical protein